MYIKDTDKFMKDHDKFMKQILQYPFGNEGSQDIMIFFRGTFS